MPVIHNKSKSKIIFPKHIDEDGKFGIDPGTKRPAEEVIMPDAHKTVSDAQYKHLKAIFPTKIYDVNSMADLKEQASKPNDAPASTVPAGYLSPEQVEEAKAQAVEHALVTERARLATEAAAKALGDGAEKTDEELMAELEAEEKAKGAN